MKDAISAHLVKAEILDLLNARARGADRYDSDLMRACHPIDGTDNHGTYQGLMHGFIDGLESARLKGPECFGKLHVIGNALFDFRDDGDVFVESYHVAHETFAEGDGRIFFHIGGRYLDTFRKVDGRWLIQHRDIVYDWSRVMPATRPFWNETTQPRSLLGTRTSEDPLYSAGGVRGRPPALAGTISQEKEPAMDAIQQLLDKQAIAEILYRRARAGDRGDADLAHSCYHPGATERHGEFDGLASDFIDVVSFTRPRPGSPIKGIMHLVTNISCDFSDADHGFVESYHVAWCQMTDGTDAEIGGRYLDRFERRGGRWAITHRDVIFDWSRMEPETAKFWDRYPAKPFLFGKRGAEDPLYAYVERGA